MNFPAIVEIKPSRRLRAALVLMHSVAASAPWISSIDPSIAVILSLLCAFSLFFHWHRPLVSCLRLGEDGSLHCPAADGGEMARVEILPGIVVHRWLLVARLRIDGKVRALVILGDSLDPGEFRVLRIWFRWLAAFNASGVRA